MTEGAQVTTFEPVAGSARVAGAEPADSVEEALAGADAVLLLVDHQALKDLSPSLAAEVMEGRLAFDLRGAWPREQWRQAGFNLNILGVGQVDG